MEAISTVRSSFVQLLSHTRLFTDCCGRLLVGMLLPSPIVLAAHHSKSYICNGVICFLL